MKEIIFLDIKLVNSLLAQLDQGLILKQISEENSSEVNQDESSNQQTKSTSLKISAGVAGSDISSTITEQTKSALVYSRGNRELVETAIDDYSLDILLDKISQKIKTVQESSDGNFVRQIENLDIYDFSLLKKGFDLELFAPLLPDLFEQYNKVNKELKQLKKGNKSKNENRIKELTTQLDDSMFKQLETLYALSNYMESLLSDCTLMKLGNILSICDFKNIRIPKSSLSLLNGSKRKATIIGIVESEIENKINFEEVSEGPNKFLSHGVSMLINIATSSFGITNQGDKLVRPIAIYFD